MAATHEGAEKLEDGSTQQTPKTPSSALPTTGPDAASSSTTDAKVKATGAKDQEASKKKVAEDEVDTKAVARVEDDKKTQESESQKLAEVAAEKYVFFFASSFSCSLALFTIS